MLFVIWVEVTPVRMDSYFEGEEQAEMESVSFAAGEPD